MDDPWEHYTKWNNPNTKQQILDSSIIWGFWKSQIYGRIK